MKTILRLKYKKLRSSLLDKNKKDYMICENLLNSEIYKKAMELLCYYPLENEINTLPIINKALKDNKKVALPVCLDESGNMEFYYINSLDDLKVGLFGIKEPIIEKCIKVRDFDSSLCIVPGYAFDKFGYRLGYGKGFYDRFLSRNEILSVGLCYKEFINEQLPINEFDKKVNYVCTEDTIAKSINL